MKQLLNFIDSSYPNSISGIVEVRALQEKERRLFFELINSKYENVSIQYFSKSTLLDFRKTNEWKTVRKSAM